MILEIFFSFLVLFATSIFVIESVQNYIAPRGFDYQDVYILAMEPHGEEVASALERLKQIRKEVASVPEVASLSLSSDNTPYSNITMGWEVHSGNKTEYTGQYRVDPSYFETLDMKIASGRALEKDDFRSVKPVVINEELGHRLFQDDNPVGKRLTEGSGGTECEVIGVVKYFRQDGEFGSPGPAMFQLPNWGDASDKIIPTSMLIEIKAGAGLSWQPQLMNKVNRVAGNWTVEINSLAEARSEKAKLRLIPVIAISFVCGFLIFNVSLGLFGVLWININKRYAEIGIRRALGATTGAIRLQMVAEVLVLATLGLSLGFLLAVQFPLLGVLNIATSTYMASIAGSLLVIYLLAGLCAWFPSRQASRIEPADALHYE